jgi:DNA mismatch repair protein MSH4
MPDFYLSRASIDADTARNLELVTNRHSPRSAMTLFGVLNKTFTPMAARLLRSNLLQPLIYPQTLRMRLDAVEELIGNEDRFEAVKRALKGTTNVS